MNRLKELRQSKNISQNDFAPMFNITQGTLSGWETGRYDISNEALVQLADYFGVSIDYLLDRDPVPTNQEELELLSKVYDDEIHVLPHEEYLKAIELAKQIKSLPPDVRDNIEQQIKLWASQDKKII